MSPYNENKMGVSNSYKADGLEKIDITNKLGISSEQAPCTRVWNTRMDPITFAKLSALWTY